MIQSSRESTSEKRTDHNPTTRSKSAPQDLEHIENGSSPLISVVSTAWEVLLVALLSTAQFTTQVGVGSPLAILHTIGHDLDATDPSQLSWIMAAYSLTVGTFILPSGRLGDVFGHKLLLTLGFAWFAVWSLAAGLAALANKEHQYPLFIVARAMQGIGPAICLPNALAILGRTYAHGRRKNMAFAAFGATAPLGSVAGAVSASLWAEYVWWPWAFWSFAAVLAGAATMTWLVAPPCPRDTEEPIGLTHRLAQLDLPGSLVGVVALVLFNFAWNQAPVSGWSSPSVITTLVLGLILGPAFFYVERRSRYPLVPMECLNAQIGVMLLAVGLGWSCFGIFLYYTWQFFELLRHARPLLASAWYSTNGVSGALAAVLTGIFLEKVGAPLAMVLAMLAYVVGTVFIATAPVQQIYWAQSFLCLLIVPFGMDISFPAATVVVSDALPQKHQGMGASLVNTVVNYSISLGLGIAGTVASRVGQGGRTPEQLLKGYRGAWYTGIGLSWLGLVISLLFWLFGKRKSK